MGSRGAKDERKVLVRTTVTGGSPPTPYVAAVRALLAAGWKRGALTKPIRQLRPSGDANGWIVWTPWEDQGVGRSFEVDILTDHGHSFVFDACTLVEVLDVLVAVGVLPAEHSSAYAAGGRDARLGLARLYAAAEAALVS